MFRFCTARVVSLLAAFSLLLPTLFAGDTVRPGLEDMESWSVRVASEETALVMALKEPLLAGLDVEAALQDWFDGRLLDSQGKKAEALLKWQEGMGKLSALQSLPQPQWEGIPDASFTVLAELRMGAFPNVAVQVVQWTVDKLKQYGVLLFPKERPADAEYPLILYCHGAAFGIPNSFCLWLAELVEQGYVVIGPAMRGEDLFQLQMTINGQILKCEGEIENLDGEVNDCLSMLSAAWKLPYVRKNEFAMIGHSFGSGAGLLTAARAGDKAKAVVSYDAWLVNPQRYYWDRMARGANNWLSWADFCNQPVADQLRGLMTRSIVHNAWRLQCPLLLFMGDAYDGSVFHLSHADLRRELDKHGKKYQYEPVPNGDHNFVLRIGSEPALYALKKQRAFLNTHYPPLANKNAPVAVGVGQNAAAEVEK